MKEVYNYIIENKDIIRKIGKHANLDMGKGHLGIIYYNNMGEFISIKLMMLINAT